MSLKTDIRDKLEKLFGITILKGRLRNDLSDYKAPVLPDEVVSNCKLISSRTKILELIPKGGVAIEVGVAYGDFSEMIINEIKPKKFYGLDIFSIKAGREPWGMHLLEESKMTHFEFYKNRMSKIDCKIEISKGFSWEELSKFPDNYFDYIYLDADHSYDSVKKDLYQIDRKIRKEGLIQINDYAFFNILGFVPYGVKRAVNELIIEGDYEMIYFCLDRNDLFDVVIKKVNV